MMKKQKILAVIPARQGSVSIKSKNIKLFNGKPLIYWSINQALKSRVNRIIVSTDSKKISNIAINYGAEVPFLRPKKLSGNKIGIEPVLYDIVEKLKIKENYTPDCLVLLMPTSPFRKIVDINQSIKKYFSSNSTSIITVTEAVANNNPYWILKYGNDNKIKLFNNEPLSKIKNRRQDLPKAFIRNDFAYVLDPKNLYQKPISLYGNKPKLMICSPDRIDVDINNKKDWIIAENIMKSTL